MSRTLQSTPSQESSNWVYRTALQYEAVMVGACPPTAAWNRTLLLMVGIGKQIRGSV